VRSGKKDALVLAQERMGEILTTHKPKPLTAELEQTVEDILKEARHFYLDRGMIADKEWSAYMAILTSGI
jgi:predicted AAA+ superfamily ATPase